MLRVHRRRVIRDGRLRELLQRDFCRNVRTTQRAAVDAQLLAYALGEQLAALVRHRQTLDTTYTARIRHDLALQLIARLANELMWQVEDQYTRILDRIYHVWVGNDVLRQRDVGEVLRVLVQAVDQLGELPRLR